jgi:hypothetical protein
MLFPKGEGISKPPIQQVDARTLLASTRASQQLAGGSAPKTWEASTIMMTGDDIDDMEPKTSSPTGSTPESGYGPSSENEDSFSHSTFSLSSDSDDPLDELEEAVWCCEQMTQNFAICGINKRLNELEEYIESRLERIAQGLTISTIDTSVQETYSQAANAFKQALVQEIKELRAINGNLPQRQEAGDTGDEYKRMRTDLFRQTRALNKYVKAVLPEHDATEQFHFPQFIASQDQVKQANRDYIKAQPSLSPKQKAWRIGKPALIFSATVLAIAVGAALCAVSFGAFTPAVVAAGAVGFSFWGGCAALAIGSILGTMGLDMSVRTSLKSDAQKRTLSLGETACAFQSQYGQQAIGSEIEHSYPLRVVDPSGRIGMAF